MDRPHWQHNVQKLTKDDEYAVCYNAAYYDHFNKGSFLHQDHHEKQED
jgi:hypothetical protein